MIELEHNGDRYMVDRGKWYRRLKEREIRPVGYEYLSDVRIPIGWYKGEPYLVGVALEDDESPDDYRVPCTDPRPPFVVGQRVKVVIGGWNPDVFARGSGSWYGWRGQLADVVSVDGDFADIETDHGNKCRISTWCLDPVEPTFGEKIIDRLEKFTEELEAGDIDPELDHILKKLKPLTDRAADVRRIKRECYEKLAALLPEEKR